MNRSTWSILGLMLFAFATAVQAWDGRSSAPPDNVVQVVSVTGRAVFAPDRNTLMRYGGTHQLDRPEIQLKPGQWLHTGNAVLARENSSVVLRWRDGAEQQVGPGSTMTEFVIHPRHVSPDVALNAPSVATRDTSNSLLALSAFERQHRPLLLFVLGILLIAMAFMRRGDYQPGMFARLLAGTLCIAVTLPVSLLLIALQFGRTAWYQPPLAGVPWTGAMAAAGHAANVIAFVAMVAGVFALWVLSIGFVSGGSSRLLRRSRAWWVVCFAALLVGVAGYVAPYASIVDFQSGWYRFWAGWTRYYSVGTWLLLPAAQLVTCARPTTDPAKRSLPWQGAVAASLLAAFSACYALGYESEYDVSTGTRADEPGSRAEARRWLCQAPNVIVGTTSDFRVTNEPGCASLQPNSPSDTAGLLQRCDIAEVDIRIDEVLRSPNLHTGQTITFQIAHARVPLEGPDGLRQHLEGKHLFYVRDENRDGRIVYVGAARPGVNRLSPLNFNQAGDADYQRKLLPECQP